MALNRFLLHFPAIVLLHLPLIIAFDLRYPAVFNFGDSNSDTGALFAAVGFPIGLPSGQTYFHESSGRFCNGRLIIDFLREAMGQPFLIPYMDSVGAPNLTTGCNFATGGAIILPSYTNSMNPFSFNIQVAQFLRFRARVLELLAEDKNLQEYLPTEEKFRHGVYMFDIGQNDLDGAFYSQSEERVLEFIPTVLSQFEIGLQKIYNSGARNFWIHNTGPCGCLPQLIALFGKNSSTLDQLGCVKSLNKAAKFFNLKLHDLCKKFQAQFPEANVTYVDIFSIKLNLISNFSQHGFKESLAACCGHGGPPSNFDNRINCGQARYLDGRIVTASPCNDTTKYVNWDGVHYTEAANKFVYEQILTGRYSYRISMSTDDVLRSR